MIELLCSYGAARPVHLLAHHNDVQTAAAVFAANPALANDTNALGSAAGHEAFLRLMLRYQPDLPKRRAIGGGTREITEMLFQHGMAANHADWLRITPLHYFAEKGDVENAAIFIEHGAEHGLDTSRVAVTGESVGGCMSAVFALMNKNRGGIDLKAQVLLYPVTNADFGTPSYIQFAEGYYLTRDGMKWFWDQYTTDPNQRAEKYASPLQASLDDLTGLPKTLVITDEADVLRDEGEQYANKLREAGVDVTSVRVAGMVHDFLLLDSLRDTRAANVARHLAIDALKTALK